MEDRRSDRDSRERIAVLETKMEIMSEQLSQITTALHGIQTTLSEARGGWKMLMIAGGSGGVLTAVIMKWANLLGGIPR